jgi:DNA-binding CsgD family transcriptional regulator
VRVEASQAGADGSVAVVVSAARPLEPLELPMYWPLTGREREIAILTIRGLDSAQIADRVFLSSSTVDWHLSNVYEKLEVDGKSGLYARFFRELMLPEFDRDSVAR